MSSQTGYRGSCKSYSFRKFSQQSLRWIYLSYERSLLWDSVAWLQHTISSHQEVSMTRLYSIHTVREYLTFLVEGQVKVMVLLIDVGGCRSFSPLIPPYHSCWPRYRLDASNVCNQSHWNFFPLPNPSSPVKVIKFLHEVGVNNAPQCHHVAFDPPISSINWLTCRSEDSRTSFHFYWKSRRIGLARNELGIPMCHPVYLFDSYHLTKTSSTLFWMLERMPMLCNLPKELNFGG
jgi:hypothetical protein